MTHRGHGRLLVCGQSQRPNGYSRHATGLLSSLGRTWDVHQFEIQGFGAAQPRPWTVHSPKEPGDRWGLYAVRQLLDELKPNAVVLLHDNCVVGMYRPVLGGRVPVVAGLPLERLADAAAVAPLSGWLDGLVVTSDPVREELMGIAPRVEIIPHGLDARRFAPLVAGDAHDGQASRRLARARLFPSRPELAHAFVVLNANRNTGRKRVDRTIAGFARFAANRPDDVRLLLHMGRRDRGVDILEEARRHGIAHKILLSTDETGPPAVPDSTLRLIYNAADVGVNTSSGEGWGFTAFEHAASGAAQIVPGHEGQRAIWGTSALYLPPEGDEAMAARLSQLLSRLADDPQYLRSASKRAYQRATSPDLEWSHVARRWDELLRAVIRDKPGSHPPKTQIKQGEQRKCQMTRQ